MGYQSSLMLIHLNFMPELSKEKILGQFFSGEKIPSLLASLLQINDIRTAIDPMCGSGDMFKPFINTNIEFWGIEIDSEVANKTQKEFEHVSIFNHDAFDYKFLLKLIPEHGFDLVITNPPFVRRELLNPISSNGIHQDFNSIRDNIVSLVDNVNYIDLQDKKSIKTALSGLSKYADLSILSWILCISLLRHGGQLALVVPTSWMTREYARTLIKLMNELFKIEYIIVDANRTWFEGAAQVQTSLIVARRKYPNVSYIHDTIKYVNLYQSSISDTSLIGSIPSNIDFYNSINSTQSSPSYFDVIALPQDELLSDNNNVSLKSKLSFFVDNKDNCASIEDFGIKVGQGLRTGANKFFYLKKNEEGCKSLIFDKLIKFRPEIFTYVIKNQESLPNSFALNDTPNEVLLNIQDYVLDRDLPLNALESKDYKKIPQDVAEYILYSETYKVNDITIPNLSAVKTNIRQSKNGSLPRFWYMIPKATKRHTSHIFIPRINNKSVICRINRSRELIFIDANFSGIWRSEECQFSEFAVMALMNSKWARIQYEENGTIMGGGALKLDAVQIKKTIFPLNIVNYKNELDTLGMKLANRDINSYEDVVSCIDNLICKSVNIFDPHADSILSNYLNQYQECRI